MEKGKGTESKRRRSTKQGRRWNEAGREQRKSNKVKKIASFGGKRGDKMTERDERRKRRETGEKLKGMEEEN